jgi:DNA-binding HxlR family transcriptional regulator
VPEAIAALADALRRVGDRWSLLVVAALLDGPRRFGDLERAVPGVTSSVLASRLRQLESDGLVVATPYSTRPARVDYRLTATGEELAGAVRLLAAWAAAAPGGSDVPTHRTCGTPLEVRWWCPACAVPAEDTSGELWA